LPARELWVSFRDCCRNLCHRYRPGHLQEAEETGKALRLSAATLALRKGGVIACEDAAPDRQPQQQDARLNVPDISQVALR
jgi:hypothetical protein